MNRARLLLSTVLLAFLSGLLGCDVAVVAVLMSKSGGKSKSSAPAAGPDLTFVLYVANFASAGAAATEAGTLESNGGNPNSTVWTFVGRATATEIWSTIPPGKNAALIQGPLTQVYNIDTFERLNANGAVIEVPTNTNIYANSAVTGPLSQASGMLDGVSVTTKITDPTHIPCVFALFTQPITALRVRIWGANQVSGDCVWSNNHELGNTDGFVVGGAAANSSGTLFTTYTDTTLGQSELLTFEANSTKDVPPVQVSGIASPTASLGVALDSSDNLFVGASLSTGKIQFQKYIGGVTLAWSTSFTGPGSNHIGQAGFAVASNVPFISAGAGTSLFFAGGEGTTGTHAIVRYDDDGIPGSYIWGPIVVSDPSSNPTNWSGIATVGNSTILTTGAITNSGKVEILTQNSSITSGAVVWPSPITTTGSGTGTNSGNAIGVDGQGFAYVAGYFGSAANGRDSVLLRYKVSDGSGLTNLYLNSTFSGANEFLGIAVDTDGTTYVVGYVTHSDLISTTASGAITSMWIARFPPSGTLPLWTATFNAGTGSDQAISVSLSGNFVYVVGQNALPGPKNGMRVFKFVK